MGLGGGGGGGDGVLGLLTDRDRGAQLRPKSRILPSDWIVFFNKSDLPTLAMSLRAE